MGRGVQVGGAVVIGLGHLDGRGNPLPQEIGATFQQAVGIEHQFPGLVQADSARFDGIVRELGWTRREVPKVTDVQSRTPEALIREFEDGVWSWTWDLTEEQRRAAAAVTRE